MPRQADLERDHILSLVYDELRRLAGGYLRRERRDHTLQPTALVHEAYLRLVDQRRVDWHNRSQLVALAAVMMRRILLNHSREWRTEKRGAGASHVPLTVSAAVCQPPSEDVIALHETLERLEAQDERKGRIVQLKFFSGLTTPEIADALNVSTATVEREWTFARAWLANALTT
jgi:RNA polymerase sigma-70 factor, ECF subfamily